MAGSFSLRHGTFLQVAVLTAGLPWLWLLVLIIITSLCITSALSRSIVGARGLVHGTGFRLILWFAEIWQGEIYRPYIVGAKEALRCFDVCKSEVVELQADTLDLFNARGKGTYSATCMKKNIQISTVNPRVPFYLKNMHSQQSWVQYVLGIVVKGLKQIFNPLKIYLMLRENNTYLEI